MEKSRSTLLKKIAIYVLSAVLILCVLAFSVLFVLQNNDDKIIQGISVCGTDISGMTRKEAEAVLFCDESLEKQELSIYTRGGERTVFKGGDINLLKDAQKTVLAAYSVGRGESFIENIYATLECYFSPRDIGYVYTYDEEKLAQILYDLGISANGERKDYILEYKDDSVFVKKGTGGQSQNIDGAISDFDFAVSKGIYNICVSFLTEIPRVPDVLSLYNETYIKPQDASYEIKGGKVVLTAEVIGRQIDIKEAEAQFEKLSKGETLVLSVIPVLPEVTLEALSQKLFNHTLGTYSTSYASSSNGRKANVELAARKINGVILAPDEVFSYNRVVGPRTRAAGFRDAPVYSNGETVEGVGGGICQVSSTLYSAVLYADLKIVKRQNHSMTVAYVPKGQDATVAYNTIDFQFKNNTKYPIKISAAYGGGKLTVSLLGTKPEKERKVKIINNVVETVPMTVEEIYDETMPLGIKKTVSQGKTGYIIDSVKIVTENGVETRRESLGRSRYKMVPTKVKVGTKQEIKKEPEILQPSQEATAPEEETVEVMAEATPEPTEEQQTESD